MNPSGELEPTAAARRCTRAARWLPLCVACLACGSRQSEPLLTRFSPAAVSPAALPLLATVAGDHLEPSFAIQLDDHSDAAEWPIRARLGDTELSELELSSSSEL